MKKYESAEMEVIVLANQDIITDSNGNGDIVTPPMPMP